MSIPIGQLYDGIFVCMLALIRCSVFIFTLPVLGTKFIPRRIKVLVTLIVSAFACVSLFERGQYTIPDHLSVSMLVLQQLVFGMILGFFFRLLFELYELAGRLISMAAGFGFADQPGFGGNEKSSMFGRVIFVFILLVFITYGGIEMVMFTIIKSFDLFYFEQFSDLQQTLLKLFNWMTEIFTYGLITALPVAGPVYIATLGLSLLNKAAPSLQVISVGFPLYMLIAFYFMQQTQGFMLDQSVSIFEWAFNVLSDLFAP